MVALVLWELATEFADSLFFPPPSQIVDRFGELWLSTDPTKAFLSQTFIDNALPSLGRVAVGWGIAVAVGVLVGTVLGLWRRGLDYVSPLIEFLRAIPAAALLPVAILVFGLSFQEKVFIIALGSVWPVLLNVIDGVRSIDAALLQTAQVFRIGRLQRFVHVVLPASLPHIFAGLRTSLPIALIMMVLSELVGATNGIGFVVLQAQRAFQVEDVWAGILLLGLIGFATTLAFARLERRLLHWHGR